MPHILAKPVRLKAGTPFSVLCRLKPGEEHAGIVIEFSAMSDRQIKKRGVPAFIAWAPLIFPDKLANWQHGLARTVPAFMQLSKETPLKTGSFIAPLDGFYRVVQEMAGNMPNPTAKAEIRCPNVFSEVRRWIVARCPWIRRNGHAPLARG